MQLWYLIKSTDCVLFTLISEAPVNFLHCREFKFDNDVIHQQLACLWAGDHLLTVELSGYINYLDRENPSQPKKVLKVSTLQYTPNVYYYDWCYISCCCLLFIEANYINLLQGS